MRSRKGRQPDEGVRGEPVPDTLPAARESAWEAVYRIVRRIPRGWVMTYGQLSTLL